MAEIQYQLPGNATLHYEQKNVPRILRPQAEAMFDQVSLHKGDRVLDVARPLQFGSSTGSMTGFLHLSSCGYMT